MRLWTIHPAYLDGIGLVAAWREGLLAQKVLGGGTRGYTHHPQLLRFTSSEAPLPAISKYLTGLLLEAQRRGYHFDAARIGGEGRAERIGVNSGQLRYELELLAWKLERRDPAWLETLALEAPPLVNEAFEEREGGIEG